MIATSEKTGLMLTVWKRVNNTRAGRLTVVIACLLTLLCPAIDFRGLGMQRSASADELFPRLDDLPPLSRGTSGASSPGPIDFEPGSTRPTPRPSTSTRPSTRPPRSLREPGLDNSLPLDPVTLDPVTEPRSPFRNRQPAESSGLGGRLVPRLRIDDTDRMPLPADDTSIPVDREGFDWTLQPISIADIEIGNEWVFEHGKPNLTEAEEDDYVHLIRSVLDRRTLAPSELPDNVNLTSAWETAFYRFAEVRKLAWQNGKLPLQTKTKDHADPFGTSNVLSSTDAVFKARELTRYSVQADMQSHPADFVGRPVVIYGLFTPLGSKELQARRTLEGEEQFFTLQRGMLRNLQNTQTIAMVDAISYVDPQSQNRPSAAWPVEKRVAIPVMIKGWFVKLWQQQPLIFTDVARILTPRPYDEYIREHVRSKRKVSDDESWLYHETLRQLQITSTNVQAAIALEEQKTRVKELLRDIREKAASDRRLLESQLRSGAISKSDNGTTEGYESRRKRLERQLALRESRFAGHQQDPASFPLYVDVFQNPDRWHGRLVTLKGHVRRVITYNGDSTLFDSQPLHELWLFTDDSQSNPTVIVTPTLPANFPVSSPLTDSVTVTGCFFKMYVYRSQQENRMAPLLLAGHISWNPSAEHIVDLAKEGHIPATSQLLAVAKSQTRSVNDTMVLLLGFVTLLVAMTIWGRVQRDRRERRRILSVVDERPDFRQTSQDLFSGPFADPRIEPTRG